MNQPAIPQNAPHFQRVRLFFGLTIGMGAGLLFWQQLLLGREMLPKFGGVPAVWLVSLAVFQTILLLGYALAHAARRWNTLSILVLLLLLAAAAAAQQIFAPALEAPALVTPTAVIAALCTLAGFSLLLISIISPMLQGLYARLPQPDAQDPYFFYSASNFGSFAGLLLFPLVLEPFFGVAFSQKLWLIAGAIFLALLLSSLAFMKDAAPPPAVKKDSEARKRWPLWLFYSFLPSALSFSATAHLINDIAPVPLLSMVPLALYLVTFILAFGKPARWQGALLSVQPFLVAFYIFRLVASGIRPSTIYDLLLVLAVFFVTAFRCHRSLAESRPGAGDLTFFYLIVALGGALGAIVNLTIIPFVLPLPLEFALFLLASLVLGLKQDWKNLWCADWSRLRLVVLSAMVFGLVVLLSQKGEPRVQLIVPAVLLVTLGILSILPGLLVGYSVVAVLLGVAMLPPTVALQRDFFGVKRVVDRTAETRTYRVMFHGTTIHGMQKHAPEVSDDPMLYYGTASGIKDVMEVLRPRHVAAVGLGTGTVACMPGKEAQVKFFEIDPGIVQLAQSQFTFLHDCPPEEMVLGDARLTLAKDTGVYDLLVVDAFSSDSIPVHLLTREAFAIYKARLKPDGVLLLHLSNRFLDLRPVALAAAKDLGWAAAYKRSHPPEKDETATPSEYAVLSSDRAMIEKIKARDEDWNGMKNIQPILWTDDRLSLMPVFRLIRKEDDAKKD
ncbi:MAG: fused MFS/spermidine synthase [Proteobacteria bacterium]|nr:fused MFS/spermidine synthase [Pseudomonadota bacterium]